MTAITAMQQIGRAAAIFLVGAAVALGGCSRSSDGTEHHRPGVSLAGEHVPLGKLPRVAIPLRYRIALKIDPRAERFGGHVEIDVRFAEARRDLFIHGLDLNMSGVSVRLKSGQVIAAHYDQVDPTGVARLIFVDQVPAGEATLIFDYDAPFDTSLAGLYKVVDHGDSYAFTQFEDTDARRAFPSFDEPGFKAPFDITVIAPKGMKVIGNTPIESAAPSAHGMVDTVFRPTKPLPTYLVALAVGPLDIVEGATLPPNQYRSKPLHFRGITARGEGKRIAFALSLTPKIVAAYENYFGVGYPFPKLDVLAVPDFAAGAMENAGAITFRERYMLVDADAPIDQKRASLAVQAHEIAHQWFGDLVTPAWWDDIWLNESFANWAEVKASQAVMPSFDFGTDTERDGVDVMDLDELPSARQVHQPIETLDDISNAFDAITYDKGSAVLAMFEDYVGPQDWRRGIHAYLTKFAQGNATAKDFIGTIAATTGRPAIVPAFFDFIDRPGVPYLKVASLCTPPALAMTQSMYEPFGIGAPKRLWRVPVCAMDGKSRVCRVGEGASFSLPVKAACAGVPNANGAAYYRVALSEDGWAREIERAPKMSPAEQVALIGNVFAGLRAGNAKAADALALTAALAPAAHWDVLSVLTDRLAMLRRSLSASDLPAYQSFIDAAFFKRFQALGVTAKKNEKPTDALARKYLATLLVKEANDTEAEELLVDPIVSAAPSDAAPWLGVAPDVRADALRATLARNPSFADRLIELFKNSDDESVRRDIVYAFAGAGDAVTIDKMLALSLGPMRIGEIRYLVQYMADAPAARAALWTFVQAHYDALAKRISPQGMGRMADILEESCDANDKVRMQAFLSGSLAHALGAERRVAHTEERIDRCIAFHVVEGPDLAKALAATAK